MSFRFLDLAREERKNFLVARLGKRAVDFMFFKREEKNISVLSFGSENTSYLPSQTALEKIFAELPKGERVDSLIITFEPAYFPARTITQFFPSSAAPYEIDEKEALAIEHNAQTRAERAFEKILLNDSGILPAEFSFRRIKILERQIGGYAVPRLAGFRKEGIEFSVLGAFLLKSKLVPFTRFAKLHRIKNVRAVHIAEALELFTRAPKKEGVYVCVGEEKTQIAVQNGGHFVFLGSIPIGEDDFIEFFADMLGMSDPSAEALEKRYARGDLSLGVREKIQVSLLPELKKFGTLLTKRLAEAKIVLPDSLWMFGEGYALGNLQHSFAKNIGEDLPFPRDPNIQFLLPQDVWEETKNFPGASDPRYTLLCLLGAYVLDSK